MQLLNIVNLRKLDRFDYFYFFVIVIYAAMALPATKNMVRPVGGLEAYIIPWSLTIFVVIKHRLSFINKELIAVTLIYFCWVLLQVLKFNVFYTGSFIFLGNILIAYILIKVYDYRMFFLYEKTVLLLSLVALFGWLFQILIPNVFTTFMKETSLHEFSDNSTIIANNIFFSLSDYARDLRGGYPLPRNAGFSWEPGRFSSMLVVAIFFNLVRNNFSLKKNKSFWVLFTAVLTTQSTTGLAALLFVMFIYVVNQPIKKKMRFLFFLFIPLAAGLIYLPFMGEKITNLWFDQGEVERMGQVADFREEKGDVVVPQRFTAILFELMNIENAPYFGYGVDSANSFVESSISPAISLPGGALKILSQFGLVVALLVYFQLYKSSVYLKEIFGYKGKWNVFILFTLLSISYTFWFVPFFSSIWLFEIFRSNKFTLECGESDLISNKLQ